MTGSRACTLLALAALAAAAQPPQEEQLGRFLRRMAGGLDGLPGYTCSQIVESANVLSGSLSGFANDIFRAEWVVYRAAESLEGRRAARYDLRVPAQASSLLLGVGGRRSVAGYTGSFWVDADTLDLLRLAVRADPLPPELGLEQATLLSSYGRVRIGASEFLLPQRTELEAVHRGGEKHRNVTYYQNCRQDAGVFSPTYPPGTPAPAVTPLGSVPAP